MIKTRDKMAGKKTFYN